MILISDGDRFNSKVLCLRESLQAFMYLCSDKSSFSRNSTKVIASSAFIEFNKDRIRPKASFNILAPFSSRSVSDKGSKGVVINYWGEGVGKIVGRATNFLASIWGELKILGPMLRGGAYFFRPTLNYIR